MQNFSNVEIPAHICNLSYTPSIQDTINSITHTNYVQTSIFLQGFQQLDS